MIRLLIVLLVVAGIVYMTLFRTSEDTERVDVQYQQNVQDIKQMEQQMLLHANDEMEKADAASQ